MGEIKFPEKSKLFIGIIATDKNILREVKKLLQDKWGEIDKESEIFLFDTTNYYEKEMGKDLIKKFYSFKKLINREDIVEIKIQTNYIEDFLKEKYKKNGRIVNLDPGYVTLSNVTLATTKDYRHRIYLAKGIYLENTLWYNSKSKSYEDWEWTYPDYRKKEYKNFFNEIRKIYKDQLKYGENFEWKL